MKEHYNSRERIQPFKLPFPVKLGLLFLAGLSAGGIASNIETDESSNQKVHASNNSNAQEALSELTFKQEIVDTDLHYPTAMDAAPDGRIFIAEQAGKVKIFENGDVHNTPFLTVPVSILGEGGLIGIKLSPDFEKDNQVFIYYSTLPDKNGTIVNRVSRFTASTENPNFALPNSEVIVVDNIPANQIHNGGGLEFDQNGMLIVGTGEAGDGIAHSQNLNSIGGKVLRVNPTDGSPDPQNPFINNPSADPRILSLGYRNVFSISTDTQSETILALDVGEHSYEEVNKVTPGGNYGWPYMEGPNELEPVPEDLEGSLIQPIYSYEHGEQGNAVTGGDVIRNTAYPKALQGMHVIGDYLASTITFIDPETAKVYDLTLAQGTIIAPIDLDFTSGGDLYFLTITPGWLSKISISTEEPTPTIAPSPTPNIELMIGDVNCDENINSIDSAFVLQFSAGLIDDLPCQSQADVNEDTNINAIDATLILQHSAGLIDIDS